MAKRTKVRAGEDERDGVQGELCVRCGEVGEDRRTLYHSCFYAMEETGVPYEQMKVEGKTYAKTGTEEMWFGDDKEEQKRKGYRPHVFPVYASEPSGVIENRAFYTLRVCKDCRSSWMTVLRDWFYQKEPVQRPTGTGVFLRQFGKTYELTEEECINKWGMHWRENQE